MILFQNDKSLNQINKVKQKCIVHFSNKVSHFDEEEAVYPAYKQTVEW